MKQARPKIDPKRLILNSLFGIAIWSVIITGIVRDDETLIGIGASLLIGSLVIRLVVLPVLKPKRRNFQFDFPHAPGSGGPPAAHGPIERG